MTTDFYSYRGSGSTVGAYGTTTPSRLYQSRYTDSTSPLHEYQDRYGGGNTTPVSASRSLDRSYGADYGITPTPAGTRPLRATTPPASVTRRDTSSLPTTPYSSARRDLNLELTRSQDRYSSRNALSMLHPDRTASALNSGQRSLRDEYVHPTTPTRYSVSTRLSLSAPRDDPYSPPPPQHHHHTTTFSASPAAAWADQQASSPSRRRDPSMVKGPSASFLPPQEAGNMGKPVIVLDLDETLVYARDGPINVRPGTRELLEAIQETCEVCVWTAGEREYAKNVIRRIDMTGAIQHCVYRHPKWWTGKPGYSKNLHSLGRPIDRVLLVDNTPDCLKDHPWNGLLVEDFTGRSDDVLYHVARVIQFIVNAHPSESIPDILSRCPDVVRRRVPLDSYGSVEVWTLTAAGDDYSPGRNRDIYRTPTTPRATGYGRTSLW